MTEILKVGVLSIQGDIEENILSCKAALAESGVTGEVVKVKDYDEILEVDGLIIPGGESTVISTMMSLNQSNWKLLNQRIDEGLPVLATCAGMILLANRVQGKTTGETKQKLLKNLDITVERNAFGRQHESFETDLNIPMIGEKPFKAVFIRGPIVKETGKDVQIIAKYNNKIVAVQQNNIVGTSFHPELTEDNRIHTHFIKSILKNKEKIKESKTQ
ncbi:MAG TPA: pyridoxal 5'-phosphate synthase glutaminase subunit PdxT [Candidatus Nitrosocosmicus sp.]|nr:pyridoxal 5'-phosphate synthase glutaminase subunit PdxT [Candidatus Nitrosocosmicus sp.]